jgi:hypothetical protein
VLVELITCSRNNLYVQMMHSYACCGICHMYYSDAMCYSAIMIYCLATQLSGACDRLVIKQPDAVNCFSFFWKQCK